MSAKFFIDTNIFIYCFDNSQLEKQQRAVSLIGEALQTGRGMISAQVVQEFLNVATRKFEVPLKPEDAKVYLRKVLHPLCRVYPDLDLYHSAIDIMQSTGYGFYDSLILAGAARGECSVLYSEDLHAGQQVGQVSIVNPFAKSTAGQQPG